MILSYRSLSYCAPLPQQRGAATLLVSLVLLIATTIVTFFTAQTVVTEQKIISNENRSMQALQAAQAGIVEAMVKISDGTYTTWSAESKVEVSSSGARYSLDFSDTSNLPSSDYVKIIATGYSDDDSSVKQLTQTVRLMVTSGMPGLPTVPLIARGDAEVGGSSNVINPEGGSSVWSGGSTANSSGNTKTIQKKVSDDHWVVSANKKGIGVDVIGGDDHLASMDKDTFFENFFGMSLSDYETAQSGNSRVVIDDAGNLGSSYGNCSDNPKEAIIVIAKIAEGSEWDAKISVCGVLFVHGDVGKLNGNRVIQGAMIVNGNFRGFLGTALVQYDSDAVSNAGNGSDDGNVVPVSGTWKDW